jgi:benzylsuccinate CoA-transferase BbsF subunit
VALAAWDDDQWMRLADVMGLDLEMAKRFSTFAARHDGIDEVEALVSAWTATRRAEEVAEMAQAAGIEAVPVADFGDAWSDPQLRHRGHFVTLAHPCMGECGYERNGFRLSDAAAGYERTSPLLGEHNDYVLGEVLGLDEAERKRLAEDGVLE